ncbi:MAG: photosystem II protein PsbQ [Cyanobacteria bacterium P01_G01_bin.38]
MKWYRSIVSVILVAIAAFTVGCSSGKMAQPEVYTPAKVAEIQIYSNRIAASQGRLLELANYIAEEDWTNVDNFIHGPLGELREQMGRMAYRLLPTDKTKALALADDIAADLERISAAADEFNYRTATQGFQSLQADLGALLDLVPAA